MISEVLRQSQSDLAHLLHEHAVQTSQNQDDVQTGASETDAAVQTGEECVVEVPMTTQSARTQGRSSTPARR